jgi:hypothetical protein
MKPDFVLKMLPHRISQVALIACVIALAISAQAQLTHPVSPVDDSIFNAKIELAHKEKITALPIGARVAAMGELLLGTPYVGGTLDADTGAEALVVNLRGLDCVTFYENALALARVIREYPLPTMSDYQRELTLLRYREGEIEGFHSRLNYSVDYFLDGVMKRIFSSMTNDVGDGHIAFDSSKIDFMTRHRKLYHQIAKDEAEFREIQNDEDALNARPSFVYIPKSEIEQCESKIETGDILGIVTDLPGLDCSHTGIAIRLKDGRIHFMHASSLMHKVIISEEPLAEYLTHSKRQIGILVNRPLEIANQHLPGQHSPIN